MIPYHSKHLLYTGPQLMQQTAHTDTYDKRAALKPLRVLALNHLQASA